MSESEFSPVWQRVDKMLFRNPTNLSPQKYRENVIYFIDSIYLSKGMKYINPIP